LIAWLLLLSFGCLLLDLCIPRRAGASDFFLLVQKEVSKKKHTLMRRPRYARVPCDARQEGRSRNSPGDAGLRHSLA
jgi:hypothetical protein